MKKEDFDNWLLTLYDHRYRGKTSWSKVRQNILAVHHGRAWACQMIIDLADLEERKHGGNFAAIRAMVTDALQGHMINAEGETRKRAKCSTDGCGRFFYPLSPANKLCPRCKDQLPEIDRVPNRVNLGKGKRR